MVENLPASAGEAGDSGSLPRAGKIPLEKGMATHSSILAWRIPWTEEPGGLRSVGSQRVRHVWATWHTHSSGVTAITTNATNTQQSTPATFPRGSRPGFTELLQFSPRTTRLHSSKHVAGRKGKRSQGVHDDPTSCPGSLDLGGA